MKLQFLIKCLLLLPFAGNALAQAGSAFVLQDQVLDPNPDQSAPTVQYTSNGGSITYDVVYNSSCSGTYQMDWTFSQDITTLTEGEQFSVTVQCTTCQDICGFRWRTAMGSASGANNLTSIPGVSGYEYNANISGIGSSPKVQAWDSATYTQQYDFIVERKNSAKDSGFSLWLGDHQIIYHYKLQDNAVASVDSNLGIFVPSIAFETPDGTLDIFFELEFVGLNEDNEYIWKLKDVGVNE